jgi:Fe2+ or Zn2+ uptake regulation protein
MPYEYARWDKKRYRKWQEADCSHEGVIVCPSCGKSEGVKMRHIAAQFGLIEHHVEVLVSCSECEKRACVVINREASAVSMDNVLSAMRGL